MLIRIVILGLIICVINLLLKKYLNEFVLPMELVFLALSSAFIIDYLKGGLTVLSDIISKVQYGEEIFVSIVKGAGICIMSKFASDICADSGNKFIADVIEFSGRVTLFVIAVPYIESMINIALAFVK